MDVIYNYVYVILFCAAVCWSRLVVFCELTLIITKSNLNWSSNLYCCTITKIQELWCNYDVRMTQFFVNSYVKNPCELFTSNNQQIRHSTFLCNSVTKAARKFYQYNNCRFNLCPFDFIKFSMFFFMELIESLSLLNYSRTKRLENRENYDFDKYNMNSFRWSTLSRTLLFEGIFNQAFFWNMTWFVTFPEHNK